MGPPCDPIRGLFSIGDRDFAGAAETETTAAVPTGGSRWRNRATQAAATLRIAAEKAAAHAGRTSPLGLRGRGGTTPGASPLKLAWFGICLAQVMGASLLFLVLGQDDYCAARARPKGHDA